MGASADYRPIPMCSGPPTVSNGLANKESFQLTFRANTPAPEPTITANEPTLGSCALLILLAKSHRVMLRRHPPSAVRTGCSGSWHVRSPGTPRRAAARSAPRPSACVRGGPAGAPCRGSVAGVCVVSLARSSRRSRRGAHTPRGTRPLCPVAVRLGAPDSVAGAGWSGSAVDNASSSIRTGLTGRSADQPSLSTAP